MSYQELEDGNYYFYVAAYYFIDMEEVYGSTKISGPYIVDTTPPLNISLKVPEKTISEMITILINATGANKMCISNLSFCNDNWINFEESMQWQLIPGYGEKTIYATFVDSAENSSKTYTTTFLDMSHQQQQSIPVHQT